MKQIVITGAVGFLGSRLAAFLASEGNTVLALDRRTSFHADTHYLKSFVSDLSDLKAVLCDAFEGNREHIFIHLAWNMDRGSSYNPQAEQLPILANVLSFVKENNFSKIIIIGSAEEYGQREGVISEADSPVLPLSPYGWSKYSAHLMAKSWAQRGKINLAWLRPFIIYGDGQAGDMLLPYLLRSMLAGEKAILTEGKQTRDFIHADDVVKAIGLLASSNFDGVHTLNLGTGEGARVRDVVSYLAELFDAQDKLVFGGRKMGASEPEVQIADITKTRAFLNWQPTIDWRNGIQHLYNTSLK